LHHDALYQKGPAVGAYNGPYRSARCPRWLRQIEGFRFLGTRPPSPPADSLLIALSVGTALISVVTVSFELRVRAGEFAQEGSADAAAAVVRLQ